MIAEEKSLIRGIDDNGVVGNALGVEIVEHATDVVINRGHAAQIVLYVALVLPPFFLFQGQPFGYGLLEIRGIEVAVNSHFGSSGCGRPILVVVVKGLWLGDILVFVQMGVFFVRLPRAVRGLVVVHQTKGPLLVARPEPVER